MSKLFIMSGPAGCGKSTWAQNYINEHPECRWVSRDKIRFSFLNDGDHYFDHEDDVYAEFCRAIKYHLSLGEDVIADATHLSERARKLLLKTIEYPLKPEDIVVVYFQIPLNIILERNAQRTGRACVPVSVIRKMYYSHTDPAKDKIKYGKIIKVKE